MTYRHLFFFACIITYFPLWTAPIDLEEMSQDFVLQTKKIEIPGYPNAFNPSIIRWDDSLLMSFCSGSHEHASDSDDEVAPPFLLSFRIYNPSINNPPADIGSNDFGLVLLDKNFNIISEPQVLDISCLNSSFALKRRQDPRLVVVGKRIYIVYSNMIQSINIPVIRRVFVAELHFDGERFFASNSDCLSRFEGESESRWQKNWVPFDYKGNLLLAYSITPHRILRPIIGTGSCETVTTSSGTISWDWGILRGGTPALLHNGEYLSFFHSSKEMKTVHSNDKKIQHYFMGAYTFKAHPPFNLTKISKEPIVGKNFYHGPAHNTWKPLRVVFPGGFVFNDKHIWIAYGRQDHEIWIAKLDKKGLFKSMDLVHAIS